MAESMHVHLRETTAGAHQRLDSSPLVRQLLAPGLTVDVYKAVLRVFYDFYAAVEEPLMESLDWPSFGLDLAARRKLPLLAKDCRFFGVTAAAAPRAGAPMALSETGQAMGLLYVVEGSTLGGQVIARHVVSRLGLEQERGLAFFTSYGPLVLTRWRETVEALDVYERRCGGRQAMVQTASLAFAELERRLTAAGAVAGGDPLGMPREAERSAETH